MRTHAVLAGMAALALAAPALAQGQGVAQGAPGPRVTTTMYKVTADGIGAAIGTITAEETASGLVLMPDLKDLPAGSRGFHLHQNPSCEPAEKDGKKTAALAAGGHYDPANTGKHVGPKGQGGHKGDLPALTVEASGKATTAVTAPQLKLADLQGRALMIHAGGDNYSDQPEPLGGGGARIACGVVGK
ncbi:MAG TPA: superoxide dismutase [Cu-Zn] SodC [Azospirillaceae bacterium]|nr:superoxide dismutase [Cu-Zn] SodC [Azospirillaceae bacterium]